METILNSTLTAASGGVSLAQNYRAVLITGGEHPLIQIDQQFDSGEWGGCGQWALSTLTDGGLIDGLSIDYGQRWGITSGLSEALAEALAYVDHPETIPSAEAQAILDNAAIGNSAIGGSEREAEYFRANPEVARLVASGKIRKPETAEERLRAIIHPHVLVVGHKDGGEAEYFAYQNASIDSAEEETSHALVEAMMDELDMDSAEEIHEQGLTYIDQVMTSASPITIV